MYRERGGEVPCKGLGSTCPGGLLTFCAKRSCPLVEGAMGEGGRKEKGGRKDGRERQNKNLGTRSKTVILFSIRELSNFRFWLIH